MKNRGFTLIELLAVIVVLGIIMVIAVTSVSNAIYNAKQSSYDSQVKLILDAARKYIHMNDVTVSTNSSKIVTLKELQDNGLVNKDIKDARTGTIIPDSTWIVVRNSSGYKYDFGYTTDGLILQYDAIFNGGINIHNDNASVNKETWKDLSGNNNDGTLSSYSYTSNSGWTSNSLVSLVGYTGSVLQNTSFSGLQSFTVELFGIFNANTTSANWPRIMSTNGNYVGIYESINGIDLTCNSTNPANGLEGYVSNGVQVNATGISGIGNMGLMNIVYNWNYNTKKLSVYRDGSKIKEYSITLYDNINFNKLGLGFNKIAVSGDYTYYTVRAYNRSLSSSEIGVNYALDRLRYGY